MLVKMLNLWLALDPGGTAMEMALSTRASYGIKAKILWAASRLCITNKCIHFLSHIP